MINLLVRRLVKNYEEIHRPEVRRAYGVLCGSVGIGLNLVLFAVKFLAGTWSGLISITADAFNNLSDAGSSIITLIGFKMAGQKPDPEHPFGHGRIEYLSGLFVSIAILFMAVELIRTSFRKVLHPAASESSPVLILILLFSIAVKLYMAYYNTSIGKRIQSAGMRATAVDSLSDCCATAAVLFATLFMYFTKIDIDGYCGILVGVFIFYAGCKAAGETISPLLGQKPSADLVNQIHEIVMSYDEVIGIHDLIAHDYGPGRLMISLHAEVPANGNILHLHDTIDRIEQQLGNDLNCEAVIHMDPILTDDEQTREYQDIVLQVLAKMEGGLQIHDFRIVKGPTHTNLIFDVVTPFDYALSDTALKEQIQERLQQKDASLFAVVRVDKGYI